MNNEREIYFSFFMFAANFDIADEAFLEQGLGHVLALADMGYAGCEFHPGRSAVIDAVFPTYEEETAAYAAYRQRLDDNGAGAMKIATNVAATVDRDPSSSDPAVRDDALAFLKSRVDITAALRGDIMMGPMLIPYGAFVVDAPNGTPVWSDALQDELTRRYQNAQPVFEELGAYARGRGVRLAIEPITHWETPGPNTLAQLLEFLGHVTEQSVGAVIDSAHETLDGAGPEVFAGQVQNLARAQRLHYAQASAPDRGSLQHTWLPWQGVFGPVTQHYAGPIAVEIFNAVPVFDEGLRLTRRKYWIPDVDPPGQGPSAYDVARASLAVARERLEELDRRTCRSQ